MTRFIAASVQRVSTVLNLTIARSRRLVCQCFVCSVWCPATDFAPSPPVSSQDAVRREQPGGARLPDGVSLARALSAGARPGPGGRGLGTQTLSWHGRSASCCSRTHVRPTPPPGCRRAPPPPPTTWPQLERGTPYHHALLDATDRTGSKRVSFAATKVLKLIKNTKLT